MLYCMQGNHVMMDLVDIRFPWIVNSPENF